MVAGGAGGDWCVASGGHAIATPNSNGLAGRYPLAVPHREGVFVAGGWFGPVGLLSDASIASAAAVARELVNDTSAA